MITIEQSIVKGLLYDEEYTRKVYPFLKEEYFDGPSKEIFDTYSSFFDKYNKSPSMETMIVSLQGKKLHEAIFQESIELLKEVHTSRQEKLDTQWLIDETEKYCVDKALFNAIYKSISIVEGSEKKLDKNAIPAILEDALSVGFNTNIGSDYLDDWERRYEYYTSTEVRLLFPLEALNKLSNGGLPPKTLNCFLAGSNVGKSALMCYLAGEWLKQGKNVLYVTLEMSEEAIQERIDANLLDCKTDDLKNPTLSRDWFKDKVKKLKEKTLGRLFVKEYPTAGAHVGHIKSLCKELEQKKKFKPDVIIVDYINIMCSSRYRSGNVNSYTIVKSIAEELRGLAVELNIPIVTATQTNRDGMTSQSPDMTSTSESIGLPQTVDWFAAIVTNEDLMEMNRQVLLLLKTRYGNKKGNKSQMIRVDFDHMRYHDIEDQKSEEYKDTKEKVSQKPDFSKPKTIAKIQHSGIPADIEWD